MACREHIERTVKECFHAFGGSCLDTPVFERKDVLTGKYGEDQKLIFDLMDQGGEQLALRYDHTVPLARYLAMTGAASPGTPLQKLWQVGKVYRRDNPVMSKGRMREFLQADFDIAGPADAMVPDAELVSLICTILTRLDLGEFTVKINHRKILDGIFEVCGVPADKIRSISSAVDKMDKTPWEEVRKEMTDEKGLSFDVAEAIGVYVKQKGEPFELLDVLSADAKLTANASAKQGLDEMRLFFKYVRAAGMLGRLSFDMSLARGLDYYTGITIEAIVEASAPPGFKANPPVEPSAPAAPKPKPKKKAAAADGEEEEIDESQVGVGSIAGGGRYDHLVGLFARQAAAEGKNVPDLPCVGASIGMDRIFALLLPRWQARGLRAKSTIAYVMAAGDGLLEERIALAGELRAAGLKADYLSKAKPKISAQFAAAEKDEVPFALILGENEIKEGLVTVKEQRWEFVDGVKTKVKDDSAGEKVPRAELVQWLQSRDLYKLALSGEA
ncbi:histidyl-tRNA synthetase [Exidia glandulosa HHB12029]|uniref:histidine--tRNA ligase n=1 Tax=Exidia glandulosa HHB12029 TaxID=1314781 RepID=A0A166ALC9_EXIGL|nr:histidyl-tRNA synthetase [Exidia glandulosa HHB12029]